MRRAWLFLSLFLLFMALTAAAQSGPVVLQGTSNTDVHIVPITVNVN